MHPAVCISLAIAFTVMISLIHAGELGRVRRCVAGFAEELWMRLLDVVPQLPPLPEVLPAQLGMPMLLLSPVSP